MTRTTIRSEDITAGQVKSADLDSSAVDTTPLEDDIAILGFKVAANGSLSKYNLADQAIDSYEDATGIDTSASTNESRNASNYYSGSSPASGGVQTTYDSYNVFSFLSSGNFVAGASGTGDILVVAGGGASYGTQNGYAGGGGAGGMVVAAGVTIAAGTHTVTVGNGGTAPANPQSGGTDGSDSSWIFSTSLDLTAKGGGKGMGGGGGGGSGGSGGGGGGDGNDGEAKAGGATTQTTPTTGSWSSVTAYGRAGAVGRAGGAGGGGAGGDGNSGHSSNTTTDGGVGVQNLYRTGANEYYAGGGGGGSYSGSGASPGGSGGGGQSYASANGEDGATNTGGGGGGAKTGNTYKGGAGGSGIVVMRTTDDLGSIQDMTLISNATTAEATPTKGDLVMTYSNGAGTATVNTDIKAYISRDNGTTYTQATLASQGTTGGHTILTAHDLDISSQPSGTSMRYKITTHNQSASKETRIQAVSLGWS